jgi:pheromone a factor receptor
VVIALPACSLCICKHLEFISSRRVIKVEKPKLRRTIFELAMCIGLPALWIFIGMSNTMTEVHNINISNTGYCFKVYRYIILEDFGCYASVAGSDAYMVVFIAPTLALSVITLVYGSTYSYPVLIFPFIRNV